MVGLAECTTKSVMLVMPPYPAISVDTVADEAKIVDLHHLSGYLVIFSTFHLFQDILQLLNNEISGGCRLFMQI